MTDPNDIRLDRTCEACPEQYDAFLNDQMVGYLRLRHGRYTVTYPDHGGELLFEGSPEGDGIFDDHERDFYLDLARRLIARRIDGPGPDPYRSPDIGSWREAVAVGETTLGYGEWLAQARYSEIRRKLDADKS